MLGFSPVSSDASMCSGSWARIANDATTAARKVTDYWASQNPRRTDWRARRLLPHIPRVIFAPQFVVGAAFHAMVTNKGGPSLSRMFFKSAEILGRNFPHLALNLLAARLGMIYFVDPNFDNPILYTRTDDEEKRAADLLEASPHEPDLFLDGDALADRLSPSLQEKFSKEQLGRHKSSPLVFAKFFYGKPFSPASDPPRVRLREWILAQGTSAVTPESLYLKAFEIANGDITSGMELVWDELCDKSEAGHNRNLSDIAMRLADITGERAVMLEHRTPERQSKMPLPIVGALFQSNVVRNLPTGKSIRGDNLSAWYHFSGTALNAYISSRSFGSSTLGKQHTNNLIYIEEDLLFKEFVDGHKRRRIDYAGADFGSRLAGNIFDSRGVSLEAAQRSYLYPNPAVYGPKWHLKPGQLPWNYGSKSEQDSE